MALTSFVLILALFLAIGLAAVRKADRSKADYLVANRSVGPWLAGLSAAATHSSGFMFVGLIGATYAYGTSLAVAMLGYLAGVVVGWSLAFGKVARASAQENRQTLSEYIAGGDASDTRRVRACVGLVTIVLLSTYAASQFIAGGKALHAVFGWPPFVGTTFGALLVGLYCSSGGLRASIWTDAAQAIVMLCAVTVLAFVSLHRLGGVADIFARLESLDPTLTDFTSASSLGVPAFILGWIAGGVGFVGQPHIMIRAMSMENPDKAAQAGWIHHAWLFTFSILAICIGLSSRLLLPELQPTEAELAFPLLASALLSPTAVGIMLAALFSATMSTADSQILCSSASLTEDLTNGQQERSYSPRRVTLALTAGAWLVACVADWAGVSSVFSLVVVSWSALGAGLGPLVLLRTLGAPSPSQGLAIATILVGISGTLVWRFLTDLWPGFNETLPGALAGLAVYCVGTLTRRTPRPQASQAPSAPTQL